MRSNVKRLSLRLLCGIIVMALLLILSGCDSSSSSYSSRSTTREEAYDAKYGKGSYAADKALLDSMRDSYNAATGN